MGGRGGGEGIATLEVSEKHNSQIVSKIVSNSANSFKVSFFLLMLTSLVDN